ncbi:MAG: hypothetical protein VYA80_07575 [Pseudomonadota bacterium]|nr:hypothetical protein [Pseudomonadota bacterium]
MFVIFLYLQVTSYPWTNQALAVNQSDSINADPSPLQPNMEMIETMVDGLAERLASDPDNFEGWTMLGTSYMRLQRYNEASNAWEKAWQLSDGTQPEVTVNFAEALIMSSQESLKDRAGDLLDSVLTQEPSNIKALWYGGLSSLAKDNISLAETRWSRLLDNSNLPSDLRRLVQQQLVAISIKGEAQTPNSEISQSIDILINLSPKFENQIQKGQFIFIFARDSEGIKPPLAVKRLTVQSFPMKVTIGSNDFMIPGLKLSEVSNIRVAARISQSGNPIESSGDLYGEILLDKLEGQNISLLIDKVVK